MKEELARRRSLADQVLAHFKAHPGVWINATELMSIGGAMAWRTRVSDCREIVEAEGGRIENRQTRPTRLERDSDGSPRRLMLGGPVISEYRYLIQAPQGPAASQPSPDRWTIPGAPMGPEVFVLTPPEAR